MKLFVAVANFDYECSEVIGVFNIYEKAQTACRDYKEDDGIMRGDDRDITEFRLNRFVAPVKKGIFISPRRDKYGPYFSVLLDANPIGFISVYKSGSVASWSNTAIRGETFKGSHHKTFLSAARCLKKLKTGGC